MKLKKLLINITIGALLLSATLNVYLVKKSMVEPKVIIITKEKVVTVTPHQSGIASFYGLPEHGRTTASGETYNMHGLSCAHHDLPFGTILLVVNKKNNKTIRVVVNDRMPMVWKSEGRVIDLSLGAAKRVDMITDGLIPVDIYIQKNEVIK